jgi:predicted phage gp36 major capsid-like protein
MKRKLTNAQMQETVADLTDDVTELKDEMREVKDEHRFFKEHFNNIFRALDLSAQNFDRINQNQKYTDKILARLEKTMQKHAESSNERLTRIETTVERLSQSVDRYLSARLNGSSQN